MASIRRGGGSSVSVAATISQASQQQQQPRLDDDQLAELREIFRSFDRNADGSLTQLELGSLLRSLGLTPSVDQLDALITRADTNYNGLVEFSGFVALVAPDLLADPGPRTPRTSSASSSPSSTATGMGSSPPPSSRSPWPGSATRSPSRSSRE